jgi:glycosyltransferase involved in cell wall biosynthesis
VLLSRGLPTPPRDLRIQVLQMLGNAIVGGMETWVLRLVQTLPKERFAFTALCPFESVVTEQLRAYGVDVEIASMSAQPCWTAVCKACALVAERRIALLHAHLPQAHVLAGLAGALTQRPVLTTIHDRQLSTLDVQVQRLAGSHVSVVAQETYAQALRLGVDPAVLSWEPNGVDTAQFRPRERSAGEPLRLGLGLPPDAPLIGYVGRLSPEKAPDVFVRAAAALAALCPLAHAVLVGEGPMHDELAALIQQLGVQDRVHLAGVRHEMSSLYGELDLLVSCSHTEAMPLVLLEAMACGLPAVATRVGGVPDIVEHGRTGWLVSPGDTDAIAACCARLLVDGALRRQMGEQARQRAVRHLDLAPSVARVGSLIERLVRPAAANAPEICSSRGRRRASR